MRLGEICQKIGSGATPTGGKNSYADSGISLIRSQNVLDFAFSYNGLAHINEEQADKLRNVVLKLIYNIDKQLEDAFKVETTVVSEEVEDFGEDF